MTKIHQKSCLSKQMITETRDLVLICC